MVLHRAMNIPHRSMMMFPCLAFGGFSAAFGILWFVAAQFQSSGDILPVFAQMFPSISCTTYFHHFYNKSNLGNEELITHGGEVMIAGSWWLETLHVFRKQRADRKQSQVLKPQSLSTVPIYSERFSLLKAPQLLKTAPPTGDHVFKHMNLWGTFYIQSKS